MQLNIPQQKKHNFNLILLIINNQYFNSIFSFVFFLIEIVFNWEIKISNEKQYTTSTLLHTYVYENLIINKLLAYTKW